MDLDVVVCAKDRGVLLERVLGQIIREISFKNLIVVYGSSSDKTKEIAEKYTKYVLWDQDKGLGAARNLGVTFASSKLVAFIDTDVILTAGWCSMLVRHFSDPKVAAVMGATVYSYGYYPLQQLFEYYRWNSVQDWGCTNTIFKRELVLEVGNFKKSIIGAGEDYDLYKRIVGAGYKWIWDREVAVNHPLTLFEFINHAKWWAKGVPFMEEIIVYIKTHSLFRYYCSVAFNIMISFRKGLKLSFKVNPLMLFLLPMHETIRDLTQIKELKRTRNK